MSHTIDLRWAVNSLEYTVTDGQYRVKIRRLESGRYDAYLGMPDTADGTHRSTGRAGTVTVEEAVEWVNGWICEDRAARGEGCKT